jgi:hypothetical protein
MKRLESQFQRLVRAAAAAPPGERGDEVTVPRGRWLLQQLGGSELLIPTSARPVLQCGLAMVCVLLLVSALVNVRQLQHAQHDVFAVSEAALTRMVTP